MRVNLFVVVIFLIISPFLRGLGAIEVSMTYILIQTGFSNVESMAITLLFRFFEFWLPLFAGIVSFLLKVEKLLLRILPAFLIFAVVLEDPIAENKDEMKRCIVSFSKYCYENGLKEIYYRVHCRVFVLKFYTS